MRLGVYVPGDSILHRMPAGAKLVGLLGGLFALSLLRSPLAVGTGALLVTALAALSGLPWRMVVAQTRPVLVVVVLIAAFQCWLSGPAVAVGIAGTVLIAVSAAGLVTLTTRTEDLLDVIVRGLSPLRVLGVRPDRVSLVLALTLRSIPVVADLAGQAQQARLARGAPRSLRAFAVPLLIRSLRHADQLGEALAARGVDDTPEDSPPGG
jgi:biotin transport system permease protein